MRGAAGLLCVILVIDASRAIGAHLVSGGAPPGLVGGREVVYKLPCNFYAARLTAWKLHREMRIPHTYLCV